MRITFLTLTFFLFSLSAFSQQELFNQSYDEIKDFDIPEDELKEYKKRGKLTIFNEEKHNTKLAEELFDTKVGKSIKIESRTGDKIYTVVAAKKIKHYRVNYIFLDGNKTSYKKIEKMRKKLMDLLDGDVKFESVARQYSMDRNSYRGGDSGWFKENKTEEDFFNAITNPRFLANEIFPVDIPEHDWYYIIEKSYSPTEINEIVILEEFKE
ncbi:MAG: peptidylprolyl isomerase [Bacteroidota bacterium]